MLDNKLRHIDLSPLRSCTSLGYLNLGYNQIQSIDLSPLSSCTNLSELRLKYLPLQSIDLTPLLLCKQLSVVTLEDDLVWQMKDRVTVPPRYLLFIEAFKRWNRLDWVEMWEFYRGAKIADKIVKQPHALTREEKQWAQELTDWIKDFSESLISMEEEEEKARKEKKRTRRWRR